VLRRTAEEFGLGLQLVNILKDVTDDRERGWSFIPRTLHDAQGLTPEELLAPAHRAAAHRVVAPVFERARVALDAAAGYCVALPAEAREIRMFCLLPLWMAVRTLVHARGNDEQFTPGRPVKITRAEVEDLVMECLGCCAEDDAIRAGYAALWERPARGA
jgi:farnesyl-diphosphate farnesyltransferase